VFHALDPTSVGDESHPIILTNYDDSMIHVGGHRHGYPVLAQYVDDGCGLVNRPPKLAPAGLNLRRKYWGQNLRQSRGLISIPYNELPV